ncbi:MAG: DUF2834 domain-containing protein [Terriglobales bacterium]
MKPQGIYLSLCFGGAILPYWQFLPWLSEHGLNFRLLLGQLFANRISAFFGIDVIVSAVVLLVFIGVERSRLGIMRWWLPSLATLTVGVSLGLPLFLFQRELALERNPGSKSE